MKIEEGKSYRTRSGQKIGPMKSRLTPDWPWCVEGVMRIDCERAYWRDDGRFDWGGRDHGLDLIAEWVEPTSVPPDSTKNVPLTFGYTNHRGEYAVRRAVPMRFEYRVSEWHGDEPVHLMIAWDVEKQAEREFMMSDIVFGVGKGGESLHRYAIQILEKYVDWCHVDETMWDAMGESPEGTKNAERRRKLADYALRVLQHTGMTIDAQLHPYADAFRKILMGEVVYPAEDGWICYNGGPDSMFWMPTRDLCEHELSDNIRQATALEKTMFERFGKKLDVGYELERPMENSPQPSPVPAPSETTESIADAVMRVIENNQHALERVPVGWNLFVKLRKELAEVLNTSADARRPTENSPQGSAVPAASEAAIKHMAERFLGWKLPETFNPDGGIRFDPVYPNGTNEGGRHEPTGTNLFDYTQAKAMVEHMLEGLPVTEIRMPELTPEGAEALTKVSENIFLSALLGIVGSRNQAPVRVQELLESNAELIERARAAEEALFLFREFTIRNARTWELGAAHHHPIWGHVAEVLHDSYHTTQISNGPRFLYIQATNKRSIEELWHAHGRTPEPTDAPVGVDFLDEDLID